MSRVLQNGLKGVFQRLLRTRYDAQHFRGGGLLRQRFAQLIEQASVLDGDDGLGGKVRHQLDLLVGEGANLLAKDHHNSNQFILLEHRYGERSPYASEFDSVDYRRITFNIKLRCCQIGELGRRLVSDYVAEKGIRVRMEWTVSPCLGERRGYIMARRNAQ